MNTVKGDIWQFSGEHNIVVPTNIGWTGGGKNVMGRGVAKQATERYPDLALWYGRKLYMRLAHMDYVDAVQIVTLHRYMNLILFPVKPLAKNPSISWRQNATLVMIQKSATLLQDAHLNYPTPCYLPLVGCGNGKLRQEDVVPILESILDDQFTLVLL